MRLSLFAALLVLLALPAAASAARVSYSFEQADLEVQLSEDVGVVELVAGPGEVNRVTLSGTPSNMVVRDARAPLTAGDGCRKQSRHVVRCRQPVGFQSGRILLGDRSDSFTVRNEVDGDWNVRGAAGDDRIIVDTRANLTSLVGGPGRDLVAGGFSEDSLSGGPGDDRLYGRGAPDSLDGGVGRDVLDGGSFFDSVSYGDAPEGVRVDLAARRAGLRSGKAREVVADIEVVTGSRFADVLRGDRRNNLLQGVSSDQTAVRGDFIAGGRGKDELIGTPLADRLGGGSGDADKLTGRGGADEITCGPGFTDTVNIGADEPPGPPSATPDCEIIEGGAFQVRRYSSSADAFRLTLLANCDSTIRLSAPGEPGVLYGEVSAAAQPPFAGVELALTDPGRRAAKAGKRADLTLSPVAGCEPSPGSNSGPVEIRVRL